MICFSTRSVLVAFALCFASQASAQYEVPQSVQALVGMRAGNAEILLQDMGYKNVHSENGVAGVWSNWWRESKRICLRVVTMDGRYDSISSGPEFDCTRFLSGDAGDGNGAGGWRAGLIGAGGSTAELEMQGHGYRNVDSYKDRNGAYSWWSRSGGSKHQCMKMTVVGGKVQDLEPAPDYPACND